MIKDVPGYEGYYTVSDTGEVFSVDRYVVSRGGRRLIKGCRTQERLDECGYVSVRLNSYGKCREFKVSRLVLIAFEPNEKAEELDANHKDGIKTNNALGNLEWATRSENMIHRYRVLKQKHPMVGKFGRLHQRALAVAAKSLIDGTYLYFDSLMDAQREGFLASKISLCLSGTNATHKGYVWTKLIVESQND